MVECEECGQEFEKEDKIFECAECNKTTCKDCKDEHSVGHIELDDITESCSDCGNDYVNILIGLCQFIPQMNLWVFLARSYKKFMSKFRFTRKLLI